MRLSVKLQPQDVTWSQLQEAWDVAESLPEIDAAWLFDHFYPINVPDHRGPCFEGWTALSFLAGRTSRVRLGLIVTGVTYRHPAVLANMCATIDQASAGRLEIGLGAAWNEEEHTAYGIAFPPVGVRMDMLGEACHVIDSLLTQETTTFDGEHYQLLDARCEPKGVQAPRPPFVLGGQGEKRMLGLVATWADQWNYPGDTAEGLRAKTEVLQGHCDAVGRDIDDIEVSMHLFNPTVPADAAAKARELAAAGADHLIIYVQRDFDPTVVRDVSRAVADAVL
ncbi:TIGR03560 family F420-dependent LLM class oxidoreductase [Jatrophihabitans sp. YIM 134969]